MSALLAIKRQRLLDEDAYSFNDNGNVVLEANELRRDNRVNQDVFFEMMSIIMHQNYYITLRCNECVSPSLDKNHKSFHEINEFLISEDSHDQLMKMSIIDIGHEINEKYYLNETILLMDVLKYISKEHFLAFCCVIESFEGSAYEDSDVVGDLLRRSILPDSAKGVDTHFDINMAEKHFNVGNDFAETVGYLPESEIIAAIKFTELSTKIRNSMLGELHDICKAKRKKLNQIMKVEKT